MRKKVLFLATILAFILLLSGCGSKHRIASAGEEIINSNFSVSKIDGAFGVATAGESRGNAITDKNGNIIGNYSEDRKTLYVDTCNVVTSLSDNDSLKSYLKDVKTVIVGGTVIELGDEAFKGFEALTTVTLKDNVEIIGDRAFSGCTKLDSVNMESAVEKVGEYAFSGCTSLREISFSDVVKIGNGAFNGCTALAKVTIESDKATISEDAFGGCSALSIFDTASNVPMGLFTGNKVIKTLILKDSVSQIERDAFSGCTALSEVVFGNGLCSIGDGAFRGCTALNYVSIIANQSLDVGGSAFDGCTSIREVLIKATDGMADTVKITLGANLFNGCTNLQNGVVFDEGVTEIGQYTFKGCTGLKTLVLPKTLEKVGRRYLEGTTVDNVRYRGTENDWAKIVRNSYEMMNGAQKKWAPTSFKDFNYTGD